MVREVVTIEPDQKITGALGVALAQTHRAEQVANLGVTTQIGADAVPEVIQRAFAPVTGLHKAAPQLDTGGENRFHLFAVLKQGFAVERIIRVGIASVPFTDSVGTGNFQILLVPEYKVAIMLVITVKVALFTGAFAHGTKRNFAQAANLLHHHRVGVVVEQIDFLAVSGLAQTFGLLQLLLQRLAVLRMGNGLFGKKQWRFVASDAIQVFFQQLGLVPVRYRQGIQLDRKSV